MLVILFHLHPQTFPYGYYGVDVFLVISGFLLFVGASRNDGGLKATGVFALKKLERIMPPVSMMVLLTMLVSIFTIDPETIAISSRTGRETMLGMANVQLDKVLGDYFAQEATLNPLLHMWYIGVTLQVYLMFALGNMAARYIDRRIFMAFLWIAGVASLLWCYSLPLHDLMQKLGLPVWKQVQGVSHYQTLPRIWEVLAGGVIFLLPQTTSRMKATVLSLMGLLAILVPACMWSQATSYCTVCVVFGTMLVIRYMPQGVLMPFLCNRFMLWLGTISFSLYLVHMPLFVCYKGWVFVEPRMWEYCMLFVLAILMGWGFWWAVEKRRFSIKLWIPLWIAALVFSVICKNTRGFYKYVYEDSDSALLPSYNQWKLCDRGKFEKGFERDVLLPHDGVFRMMGCPSNHFQSNLPLLSIGDSSKTPAFVLMGDSHAESLYAGFDAVCKQQGASGVLLSSIITPFWNIEQPQHGSDTAYVCNRTKMLALEKWLDSHPELRYVVIAQKWSWRIHEDVLDWDLQPRDGSLEAHEAALRELLLRMKEKGRHVILIAQLPEFDSTPRMYIRWCARRGKSYDANLSLISCEKEKYQKKYGHFVSMFAKLEEEGICSVLYPGEVIPSHRPFYAYEAGQLLYQDDNHVSVPGAIWFMERLGPKLIKIIGQ